MWNRLIRKHCPDEDLLAYLDGELSPVRYTRVQKHLNLCWECRRRSNELEVQARAIASALHDDTLPGPERTLQARLRFLTWQRGFEQHLIANPEFTAVTSWPRHTGLVASVVALILSVGLGIWLRGPSKPPVMDDFEALHRSKRADESLFKTPALVHQTFRMLVREVRPDRKERSGQVEVWSDSEGQRFASRVSDTNGVIQHAVWHSGDSPGYVYNPAVAKKVLPEQKAPPAHVRYLTDLSHFTADVGQLETGVLQWLDSRDWRPIALSFDFNQFVSQDGAVLRSERTGSGLCLEAERVVKGVLIKLTLELDPTSFKPRLQTIRFEEQGHVMEVELLERSCTLVAPPVIMPAVFEPHLPSVELETRLVSRKAVTRVSESNAAPPEIVRPFAPRIDRAALTRMEIEVRYALHHANACLGEPIEVVQNTEANDSYLEVRGLVETQARKEELLAALSDLPSVRIILQTAEEARATLKSPMGSSGPARVSVQDNSFRASHRQLAIQSALAKVLANEPNESDLSMARRVAAFSTHAVSLSQSALSEAWALRRLAEWYDKDDRSGLQPQSKWLLEVMIRDHMINLARDIRQVRGLLDPVLREASKNRDEHLLSAPSSLNQDWKHVSLSLFDTTARIDSLVRALFVESDAVQRTADRPESMESEQMVTDAGILKSSLELTSLFSWIESKSPPDILR